MKEIGETEKCPYCKEGLEKIPKAKKKCPHCSNFIFVRTCPYRKIKILVTEKEVEKVSKIYEKTSIANQGYRYLKSFGVDDKDIEKEIKSKLGVAFDGDIIWSLFQKLILNAASRKDYQELKMINYSMALFLNLEGKDSYNVSRESRKYELLAYKEHGFVEKVRICATKDSCECCKKQEGKVYPIDKALKEMPIPCKECSFDLNGNGKGFCRCMWVAEI